MKRRGVVSCRMICWEIEALTATTVGIMSHRWSSTHELYQRIESHSTPDATDLDFKFYGTKRAANLMIAALVYSENYLPFTLPYTLQSADKHTQAYGRRRYYLLFLLPARISVQPPSVMGKPLVCGNICVSSRPM